jgi:CheY-like chemotaxis protein
MKVSIKPSNVLVVDDDPIIRDMMVDILSFEDYPIQVARNGREAFEKLQGDENYLVFLDLMMPVMNGRELCQLLNAHPHIRNRHIIIIMSAMDQLNEAKSLQANGLMPKPFSVDDVINSLEPYMK